MGDEAWDSQVRQAAFDFLRRPEIGGSGQLIPWGTLASGILVGGRTVALAGQRGIFTPRSCLGPLSLLTAPPKPGRTRPYDDVWTEDDYLRYRYQGTDPMAADNVALRRALALRLPLVYLKGRSVGWYDAEFPVYLAADEPGSRSVLVDTAEGALALGLASAGSLEPPAREYRRRLVRERMHQRDFRHRVVAAYRVRCAICGLRHQELLDAAHIIADSDPLGDPAVPNGLALCKLHHAAFDGFLLGVRPDLVVELRPDILAEADGPMLRHGLQGVDRQRLRVVPRLPIERPDPERLAHRYRHFLERSA